jgi:hypothetical protein
MRMVWTGAKPPVLDAFVSFKNAVSGPMNFSEALLREK